MGLDGVELVLRFEEEFDLEIPDAVAGAMRTPGDVVEYVSAELAAKRSRTCETQRGFHSVRSAMMRLWTIRRSAIRPTQSLEMIVPAPNRRPEWDRLTRALNLDAAPQLVRSDRLVSFLSGAVLLLAGTAWLAGVLVLDMTGWTAALFAAGVLAATGYAAGTVTRSLRTSFPPGARTVGMLAETVAMANPVHPAWTRELVWLKVREVIVEVMGRDDFTEDSDFVRDIGIS